jgi:hypothetical protein
MGAEQETREMDVIVGTIIWDCIVTDGGYQMQKGLIAEITAIIAPSIHRFHTFMDAPTTN